MVKDLFDSKNYMDIYLVARWAYKMNTPIMTDTIYDKFEENLKKMYPDDDIFNHSYEDDDEPIDLLNKYDITLQTNIKLRRMSKATSAEVFDSEPISQRPVRDKYEAYLWYKKWNGQTICHSLKIDGISTRTLLSKKTGLVQESYSKGRGNSVTSFTLSMKKKLNAGLLSKIYGSEGNNILVSAECVVENKGLDRINSLTHADYKNGRSAALGLMATNISDSFSRYIHIFAFGHSDLHDSYSQSLDEVTHLGFEEIPKIVSVFNDTGYEDFVLWIDDITKQMKQAAIDLDIQADGVVARIDDMSLYNAQPSNELYSEGSIALKFNEFQAKTYTAIVKDISLEFQGNSSENYTVKLILEPFITDDNKTINKITGYNLSYIIAKKIKVGSEINVLYQSGCYPMLG